MSDVVTALRWFNDIVFVSLVNTSLQMTILIPLAALFIWAFRVRPAAVRYCLWLFVLVAIILLPLLTPFIPQMDFSQLRHQGSVGYGPDHTMELAMGGKDAGEMPEAGGSVSSTDAAGFSSKEMDASLINPVSVAYIIWCAGMLFTSWVIISIYRRLGKLRVCSSDVVDQTALGMLSRLKDRLGIKRAVALKASSEIYSPMSMCIFRPVIIVPCDLIDGSSDDQLEMILAHELAHIKRYDYLISLLQNILRAAFFFHPLFYLMNRSLAKEREHICDDWVIDVTGRRRGYAECIMDLLEKAVYKPVNFPVIIAMAERKRDIPRRIDMIVDKKRKITTKIPRKALAAMLIIGCLLLPVISGIEPVRFAGARMASNEGRIVFRRLSEVEANNGIWVMDADGKNEEQITTGDHWCPKWSPDGKQIVFSEFDQSKSTGIYIIDADGSNMKQLTNDPSDDWPDWSPDGRQIAFTRSGAIYVMDPHGENLRKLIEGLAIGGSAQCPDWSPDGIKIVFFINKPDRSQICVMDADGGNPKMIQDRGFYPVWSPDGKRIAFTSRRDAWRFNENARSIYVMDADGANAKTLTVPGPSYEDFPAWSPDGTKIAFYSDRDGNCEIYVMGADGQNIQRLTNTPETECYPDWWATSSYAVEPAGKLRSTWGKIKRGLLLR